ncbi:MAG: hypothetical protein IRZ16_08970 [Myxococcaceae bacterium]|nr:hypothetical protein [Myxococcaceae bacterium]
MRLSVAVVVIGTLGLAGSAFAADPVLNCPAGTKQLKVFDEGSGSTTYKCTKTSKGIAGLCHGAFLEQYSNGKTSAQGQCDEGLMTGKWSYFNRDGVKTAEIEFAKGAYHGTKIEYYPNGQPQTIETYRDGVRVGDVKAFDVTGKPVQVVTR